MTLLEVTVVLVLLGVLAGAAGVGFNALYHKVVSGQARDALAALGSTELSYETSRGSFAGASVLAGLGAAPGAVFVDDSGVTARNHFSVSRGSGEVYLSTTDSRGECLHLLVRSDGTTTELPSTKPAGQGCTAGAS
jgi:prepilin-type N-terminal cleavage/methylation domain-containing protein